MKVVTAAQMRELENRAAGIGLTSEVLMENAGRVFVDAVEGEAGPLDDKHVLVLVGPGNNGGDGLVAARRFVEHNAIVTVWVWKRDLATADKNLRLVRERDIRVETQAGDANLQLLRSSAADADIVVDALLGIGMTRPVDEDLAGVFEVIREVKAEQQGRPMVIALDVPTGIDSDTGHVLGQALEADITITLGYPKIGMFEYPAADIVGRLITASIGIPDGLAEDFPVSLTTNEDVAAILPERPTGAHKGTFGKVLTIAGSLNYVGAPCLAAEAALRVGAGLSTLAVPRGIYPIVAAKLMEVTFLPLPEADLGALGPASVAAIEKSVSDFDTVLIGPGIGQEDATKKFVFRVLNVHSADTGRESFGFVPVGANGDGDKSGEQADLRSKPLIIDADALNALAASGEWWSDLSSGNILTPHPGELSRLLDRPIDEIQSARLKTALEAAEKWQQIVILKGAFTVIASPDGRAFINPFASATMATAGSGDVLAGAIAGLIAQGVAPFEAAIAGAYLHSRAAELAAVQIGGVGVLAGEFSQFLPQAIYEVGVTGAVY